MQFKYAHLVVLAVTLFPSAHALGGKLDSLRKSTRPTPAPSASEVNNRRPQKDRDDDDEPKEKSKKQAVARGTLATLAAATRQREDRRPPADPRPRPAHRAPQRTRPPHRSHRGGSFFGIHVVDTCPPPVVAEHYYYSTPPMGIQPSVVAQLPPEPVYLEPADTSGTVPLCVTTEPVEILPPWHARFGIAYGSDVEDVSRFGFDLLANQTGGLGVDTGFRIFRERDAEFRDHLWVGDLNIIYELFPTEFIRPRAGIGVNWLADRYGAEAGLNLTVGADIFVGPIVLSGELDVGTLGDADLFHGVATAGVLQGEHLEWFAGYDYLDVGGVPIRSIVGGIRFRF